MNLDILNFKHASKCKFIAPGSQIGLTFIYPQLSNINLCFQTRFSWKYNSYILWAPEMGI